MQKSPGHKPVNNDCFKMANFVIQISGYDI